jgi:hypothetical protein
LTLKAFETEYLENYFVEKPLPNQHDTVPVDGAYLRKYKSSGVN